MANKSLGPRTVTATTDKTGNNTGNYTAVFDPATMAVKWTQWQTYKMVVNNALASGVVAWTVFIGIHQYEGYQSQGQATWSDAQPMVVDSGENVYFYFDLPVTGNAAPTVTLWVSVDLDIARIQQ